LKRTKEEAEETRKNLINIALREFVKHGYDKITLENIAQKAGVTRGAIYWHFKNKSDLMESLIKQKDYESLEIMKNIFEAQDLTPLAKLEDLVFGNFPDLNDKEAKNYARIKLDLYMSYIKHGDKRKIGITFVKYISSLIKELQQSGVFKKNIDADETAFTIFTLLGGLIMRFNIGSPGHKTMQSLRNVLKTYIEQIKN